MSGQIDEICKAILFLSDLMADLESRLQSQVRTLLYWHDMSVANVRGSISAAGRDQRLASQE